MNAAEWNTTITDWIQTGAVVVATIFAARGFSAWRAQLIGKKKYELATQILEKVFEIRDLIKATRSPARSSAEAAERERHPGETKAEAQNLDAQG